MYILHYHSTFNIILLNYYFLFTDFNIIIICNQIDINMMSITSAKIYQNNKVFRKSHFKCGTPQIKIE